MSSPEPSPDPHWDLDGKTPAELQQLFGSVPQEDFDAALPLLSGALLVLGRFSGEVEKARGVLRDLDSLDKEVRRHATAARWREAIVTLRRIDMRLPMLIQEAERIFAALDALNGLRAAISSEPPGVVVHLGRGLEAIRQPDSEA